MTSEIDDAPWKRLQVTRKQNLLFYKFDSQSEGLKLQITDIVGIFSCSVSREQLKVHVADQTPSIDPSESDSQYQSFCTKLNESLRHGGNKLKVYDESRDSAVQIELSTTLDLPKPLRPLSWTFRLDKLSQSEFSAALVVPLLHELHLWKEDQEHLYRIIEEKDHVMSKLLDRLETSGTDLGMIFPSITGGRSRRTQITVSEASKHIPGIAAFDKTAWTRRHNQARENTTGASRNLSQCFAEATEGRGGLRDALSLLRPLDGHYDDLGLNDADSIPARRATLSHVQSSGSFAFETDKTFLNSKKNPPNLKDDTSSMEEDLEPKSSPATKSTPAQMGRMGRSRTPNHFLSAASSSSPEPTSSAKRRRKSDDKDDSISSSNEASPAKPAKPMVKSGLGKIGSKPSMQQKSPTPSSKPPSTTSTPSRKLGMVGRMKEATPLASQARPSADALDLKSPKQPPDPKRKDDGEEDSDETASPSPPATPSRRTRPSPRKDPAASQHVLSPESAAPKPKTDSPGRTKSKAKPEPEPKPDPETEEQAAARRREELKRTLKADGGAKKKRKF